MASVTFDQLMSSMGDLYRQKDRSNYESRLGFILVSPTISEFVGKNQRAINMFLDFLADCEILDKRYYSEDYFRYLIRNERLLPLDSPEDGIPFYTVQFHENGSYHFLRTKHSSKAKFVFNRS